MNGELGDGYRPPISSSVFTTKAPVIVIVDGNNLSFDVPSMILNGRTLVPLRAIFEALGPNVNGDGNTKTITGKKEIHQLHYRLAAQILWRIKSINYA